MKKLLWPVLEKPWEQPDMELHYGLWIGVSALYSRSGRQLGEENARPFALNHHIPADTIISKYEGSRSGKAINMSALKVAMQNFEAACLITDTVRAFYLEGARAEGPLGLWDLYVIARASIALIAYQQRYLYQWPKSAAVCEALTSQYQFISGVFMICRDMMEKGDPVIASNTQMSANALYSYADEHGIFLSPNGMACAGSTKKIKEFLELCIHGETAVQNAIDLNTIVTHPNNWYQYALQCIEMDCVIEAARMRNFPASKQATSAARIYDDLRAYCSAQLPVSPGELGATLEDRVLERQNAILARLGRPKISSIPAGHFAARMET